MPTRRQLANALRVLAIDAINKAQSGHPGAPLGMADMAEALWRHGLKHNPSNPQWIDRDRFVLSNGHASMLLYGLLHLSGYALTIDDIKNFRQLGSKTPGHPEYGVTEGVDMSTGPLGQGLASAVGMALAERILAETYNRPNFPIFDHYTYCFCGDGCLMEGVTAEASSLAGTWGLGRLIVYYDANGISIDGKVDNWFSEDVIKRYKAYGWQVLGPLDGHDAKELDRALKEAQSDLARPSLIVCSTHIGFGAPEEDSAACHGAPLSETSIAKAREAYDWPLPPFTIPEDIYQAWDAKEHGARQEEAWNKLFTAYAAQYPELASDCTRRLKGTLPDSWDTLVQDFLARAMVEKERLATRKSSQKCLTFLTSLLPELIGGSADLTGSVGTKTASSKPVSKDTYSGNYLYYGVREFGMSCIMNGLALHGGFIPYAGTFLSFSDQAKNALRLASLMQTHAIWVFTHDSLFVGEDGPTHQPVEQLPSLRLIPGMTVYRPCDTVEMIIAWKLALERKEPSCLVLSRQTLPFYERDAVMFSTMEKGGYILRDCEGTPELILLATGSEVELACGAYEALTASGRLVRVVSLLSCELFDAQDTAYKEEVLPSAVRARLAIEAASPDYFWKYVGLDGTVLGMTTFGLSAKAKDCAQHFGFTVDRVVEEANKLLDRV
ncbi:MAG: transketolase [Desulfovibrio sp.]|nr:transketolase [Desulfovibrio sp.]